MDEKLKHERRLFGFLGIAVAINGSVTVMARPREGVDSTGPSSSAICNFYYSYPSWLSPPVPGDVCCRQRPDAYA